MQYFKLFGVLCEIKKGIHLYVLRYLTADNLQVAAVPK